MLGKSLNVSLNSSRRRQKPKLVSKIYNLSSGVKCYEKKKQEKWIGRTGNSRVNKVRCFGFKN